MPASRRASSTGESARSLPVTWAPSWALTRAHPFMPAPPMPTKWRRLPAQGAGVVIDIGAVVGPGGDVFPSTGGQASGGEATLTPGGRHHARTTAARGAEPSRARARRHVG